MEKLDSTAVQLKYKDSTISMIIVLPNKRTGLAALDAQLKTTSLEYVVGKLHSHDKVKVSMPKFKVEFSVSLTETLKKVICTGLLFLEEYIYYFRFFCTNHVDGHEFNVFREC